MATPSPELIRDTIELVVDPVFKKTLGELKTLKQLEATGNKVSAVIAISSPADDVKQAIELRIKKALQPLGIDEVEVKWDVRVPTRPVTSEDPIAQVRNIILVMSGKGGVGKSTIATNLALALSRMGTRVGLLDADIYGPSIPTMLGIQGRLTSKDGQRAEPLSRFGIQLMSIGFLLDDPKQAVVWRGPMLHGALQQFVADVAWGELDYLILDMPPGTGDVALSISQKVRITGAIIVTTPQEVALQDVYKSVSMCQKLEIPILGVVENMSYFIDSAGVRHELFGSGGGQSIAEFAKAPLLGQIPLEPNIRQWGDQGTPVVQAEPQSSAAKAFSAIAEAISENIAREHFEAHGGKLAPPDENRRRLKILK